MSIFSNIFGTSNAPAPAPVVAPTPAPAIDMPTAPVSPLDDFKDFWQPVKQEGVDNTLPENMFAGLDPAKMLESARKVDFAKSIPPEILAKVTAGGPDAGAALMQILNDVSQRSYAQASIAATGITKAALQQFRDGQESRLPDQIRKFQVSDSIREANPALQHPAAQPIMDALQSQFSVKYPNATVTELRDMASKYLTAFATTAVPAKKQVVAESEDWGKFFA